MQYAYVLTYLKIDLFFNFFQISNSNFRESIAGILGEFWYAISSAPG